MRSVLLACAIVASLLPQAGSFQHALLGVARPSSAPRSAQAARGTRHGSILLAAQAMSSAATLGRPMTGSMRAGGGNNNKMEEKEREFELNRGKAVDTLLTDYASMFDSSPMDWSIYHDRILLKDNQGFSIEGKKSYKLFFRTVTNLLNLVFSDSQTSVVLMDKYGIDKSKIKLRWRIELRSRLNPRSWKQVFRWMDRDGDGILSRSEINDFSTSRPRPGTSTSWRKADASSGPLVLEGISEYKLDAQGLIYEHIISVTYPTAPWSLAPLQELLPIRRVGHPGLAGVAGWMAVPIPAPVPAQVLGLSGPLAMAAEAHAAPMQGAAPLLASGQKKKDQGEGGLFASILPAQLRKKIPKTCESDYDCNPGGYNFPLICADFVVARFCIDPDDWRGGGLGALAWDPTNLEAMVKEPIPVRPEDGYGGGPYN